MVDEKDFNSDVFNIDDRIKELQVLLGKETDPEVRGKLIAKVSALTTWTPEIKRGEKDKADKSKGGKEAQKGNIELSERVKRVVRSVGVDGEAIHDEQGKLGAVVHEWIANNTLKGPGDLDRLVDEIYVVLVEEDNERQQETIKDWLLEIYPHLKRRRGRPRGREK